MPRRHRATRINGALALRIPWQLAAADLFHGCAVFEPGTASTTYKIMRLAVGFRTAIAAGWHLAGRAIRAELAYPGLRNPCGATYAAMSGSPPPFRDDEVQGVAAARDRVTKLAAALGQR